KGHDHGGHGGQGGDSGFDSERGRAIRNVEQRPMRDCKTTLSFVPSVSSVVILPLLDRLRLRRAAFLAVKTPCGSAAREPIKAGSWRASGVWTFCSVAHEDAGNPPWGGEAFSSIEREAPEGSQSQ